MKANEFVKKFGIHIADHCLNDCASPDDRWFVHHGALIDGEDFDDLKRLVESHELVEKYKNRHGGIRFRIRWGMFRYGDTQEFNDRLKQAIADVESCMEVSSGSN
ncbi:MAG: hypothetical protein H9855_03385 [Candidatus Acinetobacter avistercoris]|nr:hypothetical protein [Candidatus Acinetobacter avistercoris]